MNNSGQFPQFDLIYQKYRTQQGIDYYRPYTRINSSLVQKTDGAKLILFLINETLYGGNYTFPTTRDKVVLPNPPMEFLSTEGNIFSLTHKEDEDLNILTSLEELHSSPETTPSSSPKPSGSGTSLNRKGAPSEHSGNTVEDTDDILTIEQVMIRVADVPVAPLHAEELNEIPAADFAMENINEMPAANFINEHEERTFLDTLTRQFRLIPALAVFKYTSTRDPRYFLGTPKVLTQMGLPERTLKRNGDILCHLYRFRVSGDERRGIYTYVSKANQKKKPPSDWITCPEEANGEWHLLATQLSPYIRKLSLEQLYTTAKE